MYIFIKEKWLLREKKGARPRLPPPPFRDATCLNFSPRHIMADVIDGRLPLQFCLEYVRNHLAASLPRIVII